jgi:dienelactone hydrolase
MSRAACFILLCALAVPPLAAQTSAQEIQPILAEPVLVPEVAVFQLRDYIVRRVAGPPPVPSGPDQWTTQAGQLRERLKRDVVYRGWPEQWVNSLPRFEEAGVVNGDGYRIRKFRYEIVPGFQGMALLYEPAQLNGKVPAILNVNGHVGAPGKSVEYKQKRCITFAKSGIVALNLEWLAYGELGQEGNGHMFGAHLDLLGVNELGIFYLAMRRGLDYLEQHPNVDPERLAMTGLSGGGWQTIILSSLDERVKVSVPVAGFSSIISRAEDSRYGDIGDIEQSAADLFDGGDYSNLVALRAPRPTLLVYNAEDDCCFRAGQVKPLIYDPGQAFFALFGKDDDFQWYENRDPGTHNYLIDNRRQANRFLSKHLGLPIIDEGPEVWSEVKSYDDLVVGGPEDNLTILDLARKMAANAKPSPLPSSPAGKQDRRERLKKTIRLRPAELDRVWTVAITKHGGVETRSHLFATKNGLTASGVHAKPIEASKDVAATIVLDDRGQAESGLVVADRLNRGEQVLALDPSFIGASWPQPAALLLQMVSTQGDRPLGIEVAQLLSIAEWFQQQGAGAPPRIETHGIRSRVIALTAAAIQPNAFSEIVVRGGMESFDHLLEKPVTFSEAPDLFCFGLYSETSIEHLTALASPAVVRAGGEIR